MSTIYRAPESSGGSSPLRSTPVVEPQVAAGADANLSAVSPTSTAAPMGLNSASAARPWWVRIPTPLFITAYGVILIALVVSGAMLVNYSSDSSSKTIEMAQPVRPFNKAPIAAADVAASVRTYLIENPQVTETETGVGLRGEIAESALLAPSELTGHLSRLLEQNCLDTVTLTDPDGMRLNFWGFCFSTIPPATIEELLTFGREQGADAVSIQNYAYRSNRHEAKVTWIDAGSSSDLDALVKKGRKQQIPDEVDRIVFTGFGDTEVAELTKDRKTGLSVSRDPAGDAFREQWGLP